MMLPPRVAQGAASLDARFDAGGECRPCALRVPGNSMYIQTCPKLLNTSSGPEIGLPCRMSAGFWSGEPQSQPSGPPKAGRRADFEALPIRIQLISGPEVVFVFYFLSWPSYCTPLVGARLVAIRYSMLRNSTSRPEIGLPGRISAG